MGSFYNSLQPWGMLGHNNKCIGSRREEARDPFCSALRQLLEVVSTEGGYGQFPADGTVLFSHSQVSPAPSVVLAKGHSLRLLLAKCVQNMFLIISSSGAMFYVLRHRSSFLLRLPALTLSVLNCLDVAHHVMAGRPLHSKLTNLNINLI